MSSMPHHAHDPSEASGLLWASVQDTRGRQYLTDQLRHRVEVREPTGETWTFGQRGRGAGDLRFPRGLAVASRPAPTDTRIFVADTWNHRVQVFDGAGALRFAFGGEGSGRGQFRAPADVVIASPALPWEGERGVREALPVLVVADQWNNRLQVFTLEGAWLASVEDSGVPGTNSGRGWPFFRLAALGLPQDPVRLSWNGPWLTVTSGDGRSERLDLAVALLPTFEQWQASATVAERAHARRYFSMLRRDDRALPARVQRMFAFETCVA
jgi:hypothetical protein